MISFFKRKINKWKDHWRFKLSGFSTYDNYILYTDPAICLRANTVDQFYHGYPFIAIPEYSYPYTAVIEWCTNNCKSQWRNDWHRVDCLFDIKGRILSVDPQINELGGVDIMFFAFKSLNDYNWFLLRWNTHVYKK